ncbi:MAG: 1-deoxy-D-xylulose-5-phosphate reductoisomerase [Phycisphaerales bacterium]|nr:1-deoxy-D-xylulose-5-phosphate reductoisomerase [Phycisphaerales bacterium]
MPTPRASDERRLWILGSTGSIGESAIDVITHLDPAAGVRYRVAGLAAGRNGGRLAEQARALGAPVVAVADADAAEDLRRELPSGTTLLCGADAAQQMIESHAQRGDMVLAAMVGAAGIAPVMAAIGRGCDIALANKETLVAAGAIVMSAADRAGVQLLAVDSEHSAVAQCMRSGQGEREVARVVLTASGGPFRTATREQIMSATVEQALRHPTWSMGRKISIDSATMMNKALEVVEAHWLFGLDADRIDAIVHPQSIVHSFVEFTDGSVIAQLSPPDMRLPIQYALTAPARAPGRATRMDWRTLGSLAFEPVDHDRFPAISLAWRAIRAGGTAGAVLNAANEAAVDAFCAGHLRFGEIAEVVAAALDSITPTPVRSLADVYSADAAARAFVAGRLAPA